MSNTLICTKCKVKDCECVPYDVECDSCRRAYQQGYADAINKYMCKLLDLDRITELSVMEIAEQLKERK